MTSAKFVGRVGALAVALGVGVSIAGATGVATADTGTGDTGSTQAAGKSSRSVSGPSRKANPVQRSGSRAGAAKAQAPSSVASGRLVRPRASARPLPKVVVESQPAKASVDTRAASVEPAAVSTYAVAKQVSPPAAITDLVSVVVKTLFGADTILGGRGVPFGPSAAWAAAAARRELELLSRAVAAQGNWLENVLQNEAPVLRPQQLAQDPRTGVIVGHFNAADTNGDPLVYTVIDAPDDGTVTIDAKAGTYTYTPTPNFALTGGWDGFTVRYDDAGFHLFDSVEAQTRYISVWVDAVDPGEYGEPGTLPEPTPAKPPERTRSEWPGALSALRSSLEKALFDTSPVALPIDVFSVPSAGIVMGTLNASDPNGDALTFTVVTQPTAGTVIVDDNGGYFYQVDPDSELAASGGTDTFTVRVDDRGWHLFDSTGPTVVEVTVAVPKIDTALPVEAEDATPLLAAAGEVTYSYKVHNQSGEPVRVTYSSNELRYSPASGTVLDPNKSMDFNVVFRYGSYADVALTFTTVNSVDPYTWTVDLGIKQSFIPAFEGWVKCSGACTPGDRGTKYLGDDVIGSSKGPTGFYNVADVVLLARPGTKRIIGPQDTPLQQSVMEQFCSQDKVKCTWDTQTLNKAYGQFSQALPPYDNYNSSQSEPLPSDSFEVSHQWAFGFKLSVKAIAKLTDTIGGEVAAEFNATWTTGRKYVRSYTGIVPPQRRFIVWKAPAVLRLAGDVTVQQGNITYVVQNVGVDMPDVKAAGDGQKPASISGREPDWVIGQPLKLTTDTPPETYDPKNTYP